MKTLLLVPTLLEATLLTDTPEAVDLLAGPVPWRGFDLALTGMGPVDAGVAASRSLALGSYERCILAGLAGAYMGRGLTAPTLVEARHFVMDALGALGPMGVQPLEELGLPDSVRGPLTLSTLEEVQSSPTDLPQVTALTVAACSATSEVARDRVADLPQIQIEEMEGFAVARACRLAGVPMTCLRAVSNLCGDREKSRWHVPAAMALIQEHLDGLAP